MSDFAKPTLLVLASTYPRWRDDPEPGFVHELCRRLTDDFNVVALVPDAPQADSSGMMDGVEVMRYRYAPRLWQTLVNHGGIATNLRRSPWKWGLVPGFLLGQYFAARRLMKSRRVDVMHAHWLIPQGLVAHALRKRYRVPYLVTSHGGDLFGLRGPMLAAMKRKVAASSAGMSVVSSAMRQEAESLDLRPPSVQVLPMGVDLRERFVVDDRVERAVDQLLFIGRLVPKKGLRHLLDAMPAVLAERPQAVLKIVGFGPEEATLRAQTKRLGIEASVNFLGAMPQCDLPAMLRQASLFVAPFVRDESGNQEGLPVVLMEAIGCGCPVIVGDVAGIHDLLGDARSELCVQAGDPLALASAIVASLDRPADAQARAKAIRISAEEWIDWSSIAARYSTLIRSCLAPSGD